MIKLGKVSKETQIKSVTPAELTGQTKREP